jgi:hypothetical protein
VTAEFRCEMAVPIRPVTLDSLMPAVKHGGGITSEKRRRPAAMEGLEEKILVLHFFAQCDEFISAQACLFEPAARIRVEPQPPDCPKDMGPVAESPTQLVRASIDVFHLLDPATFQDGEHGTQFE